MRDDRLVPLRLTLMTLTRILRFLGQHVFHLALTIQDHRPPIPPKEKP